VSAKSKWLIDGDRVAQEAPPDLTPNRRDITRSRQEEMDWASETGEAGNTGVGLGV
jgi:hypothetical protein